MLINKNKPSAGPAIVGFSCLINFVYVVLFCKFCLSFADK